MSEPTIPPAPVPGAKFVSPGHARHQDGVKVSPITLVPDKTYAKPEWLRMKLPSGAKYQEVMEIVKSRQLSTVCAESKCPNISGMLGPRYGHADADGLGARAPASSARSAPATRRAGWTMTNPPKVAQAVALMGLKYVVLTSVDRDDLADGGAALRSLRACHPRAHARHRGGALTPGAANDLVAQVLDAAWPPTRRT